jgi:ketol-acid reductoisomerase
MPGGASDKSGISFMSRSIGIIGFGNQGKAWALNLKESGWAVTVFLRPQSPLRQTASDLGLAVKPLDGTLGSVPILAVLIPDDAIPAWIAESGSHLRKGQSLVFAHGYALHYKTAPWPAGLDRILVAPKGIGAAVRSKFVAGSGVPAVLAVDHDSTGRAWQTAQDVAEGIGSARVGTYRATARDEVEADLFSEQALLCGGLPALIAHTYDVLVKAGIQPEVAYLECVHELAFIADLIAERGIHGTLKLTSPTARFGGIQGGKRLITPEVRKEMERIFADIRNGNFRRELTDEARTGFPVTREAMDGMKESLVETVGADVRKRIDSMKGEA